MSNVVLTKRQLKILAELAETGVKAHYMPYMGRFNQNPYYFLSSSLERCTTQVRRLLALGFVSVTKADGFTNEPKTLEITKSGRRYLKEATNAKTV